MPTKANEPAQAATGTSSKVIRNDDTYSLCNNDSTESIKSQEAIEKLDKEYNEGKDKLNRYAKAISCEGSEGFNVLTALKQLCEENEEFAQAVMQQDKTVCDCLNKVVKGVKQSLSDLLALKRAAQFYFPWADIRLTMSLDLGDGGTSNKSGNKSVELELDSLLDF